MTKSCYLKWLLVITLVLQFTTTNGLAAPIQPNPERHKQGVYFLHKFANGSCIEIDIQKYSMRYYPECDDSNYTAYYQFDISSFDQAGLEWAGSGSSQSTELNFIPDNVHVLSKTPGRIYYSTVLGGRKIITTPKENDLIWIKSKMRSKGYFGYDLVFTNQGLLYKQSETTKELSIYYLGDTVSTLRSEYFQSQSKEVPSCWIDVIRGERYAKLFVIEVTCTNSWSERILVQHNSAPQAFMYDVSERDVSIQHEKIPGTFQVNITHGLSVDIDFVNKKLLSKFKIKSHNYSEDEEIEQSNPTPILPSSAQQNKVIQENTNVNQKKKNAPNPRLVVKDENGDNVFAEPFLRSFLVPLHEIIRDRTTFDFPESDFMNLRTSIQKNEVKSAMITGDAGSGKTSYLYAFIKAVREGKFSEIDSDTEFWQVSAASLGAGSKFLGSYEARMNALLKYSSGTKVIIILDEAHSLLGQGAHSQNSNDVFEMIKTELSNGDITVIGTTTPEEFTQFRSDPALERRFPEIKVKPILKEQLPKALDNWILANKHQPLSDEGKRLVIDLSQRFDAKGSLVSRATSLLDEIYSQALIEGVDEKKISNEFIRKVASRVYNIPSEILNLKLYEQALKDFESRLDKKVYGLTDLKSAVKKEYRSWMLGTTDRTKPLGRWLIYGGAGLGKTYFAESLGFAMHAKFRRFNMNTYQSYENGMGPNERLLRDVGDFIRENGKSVIFFDELEKAPPEIQNALLQLLDSNTLTYSSKESKRLVTVTTENTIIIAGTNAGGRIQEAYQEERSASKNKKMTPGFLSAPKTDSNNNQVPSDAVVKASVKQVLESDGISRYLLDRFSGGIFNIAPAHNIDEYVRILEKVLLLYIDQQTEAHGVKFYFNNLEMKKFLKTIAKKYFGVQSSYRDSVAEMTNAVRDMITEFMACNAQEGTLIKECALPFTPEDRCKKPRGKKP